MKVLEVVEVVEEMEEVEVEIAAVGKVEVM